MQIRRVGVVGAGTMGNGIAHVFARGGYAVMLCDLEQRFLDRGLETIAKNLDREVAKDENHRRDRKLRRAERITPVLDRGKLADCDFVIEAATEKFEIKTEIFRDLDRLPCRGYSRLQHFFHFDHQARGAHQAAGAKSSACTSSIQCR